MLPIGDENPTRVTPFINWTIIATCILVFIWQSSIGRPHFLNTLQAYGLIPKRVLSGSGLYTFVTNIFLHGSWIHLLGNMLFLWIFGDNIEDNVVCRSNSLLIGRFYYLAFYLICGIAASGLWFLSALGTPYPAVGASGAIAGVLGAYFSFYPNRQIRTLVGFGFFFRVIRIRAFYMIGVWFIYQFLMAVLPGETGVAFWAHVGGFIIGMLLSRYIKTCQRAFDTYYSPELDYLR